MGMATRTPSSWFSRLVLLLLLGAATCSLVRGGDDVDAGDATTTSAPCTGDGCNTDNSGGGEEAGGECPYANGLAIKRRRSLAPYQMFASGVHEPKFSEERGTMTISVAWTSVCSSDVEANFFAEHLEGPMNVVVPLRVPEPDSCTHEPHQRESSVEVQLPDVALEDTTRPLLVALPEGSEFEVYLLRPSSKATGAEETTAGVQLE